MNKNYVYIDFEAISDPFARVLAIPVNTPFAYTVGALSIKIINLKLELLLLTF